MNRMFSNGTEYMVFQEQNCDRCGHYVDWEEATPDNPVCPIEERLAAAMFDESVFPHEHLAENEKGFLYCKNFGQKLQVFEEE